MNHSETVQTVNPSNTEDRPNLPPQVFTETLAKIVKDPEGLTRLQADLEGTVDERDANNINKALTWLLAQPGWAVSLVGVSGVGLRDDRGGRQSSTIIVGPNGGYSHTISLACLEELAAKIARDIREQDDDKPNGVSIAKIHMAMAGALQSAMERVFPEMPAKVFELRPTALSDPKVILDLLKDIVDEE